MLVFRWSAAGWPATPSCTERTQEPSVVVRSKTVVLPALPFARSSSCHWPGRHTQSHMIQSACETVSSVAQSIAWGYASLRWHHRNPRRPKQEGRARPCMHVIGPPWAATGLSSTVVPAAAEARAACQDNLECIVLMWSIYICSRETRRIDL